MAAPTFHPRRRPSIPRPHVDLPDRPALVPAHEPASPASSLKKRTTFHSPTSPSLDTDPILSIPSLPRRSPTDISANNTYIDQVIGAVDRSFSDLKGFASDSPDAPSEETLPVPRFMINTSAASALSSSCRARPASAQRQPRHKHHSSDSGIGSTESSAASAHGGFKPVNAAEAPPAGNVTTGINGVAMNRAAAFGSESALSEYACRQIQKHIIVPILKQQRLKNFHPLVEGLPRRVHRKEITCLRDLEKVLLYLAPKTSVSKASFLLFCETSIQCIHTAVEYLNEHDQRRPADRPYTNGYFVDLVEQVRQYASMISAERARSSHQEDQEQTESGDHRNLQLVGGLSQTGRPAEFIVTQGDRFVSLRTGQEVTAEELKQGTKRAMAWSEEDEAQRSMARRRKSASLAERQEQRCSECDKTFKRPCDLTKHEKTHSRPWKCAESTCKYHEYGWPTEKERDRHMNDKHSAAPPMHKCLFAPCPYESKRESNCKQHMEKAHGWNYVRSKNNGKTGRRAAAVQAAIGRTPPTPLTGSPASAAAFNAPTPDFSDGANGYTSSPVQTRRSLQSPLGPPPTNDAYMHDAAPPFSDMFASSSAPWADANVDYSPMLPTTSMGNVAQNLAWDPPQSSGPTMGALRDEDTSIFGTNFDWSAGAGVYDANTGLQTPLTNLQLATPATSVASHPMDTFGAAPYSAAAYTAPQAPTSLSPTARPDIMFSSPWSMQADGTESPDHDEGFGDFAGPGIPSTRPTGDFALFDGASTTTAGSAPTTVGMTLFGELAPVAPMPTGWSGRGTELAQHMDLAADAMEH